jgi:hypothetical protein
VLIRVVTTCTATKADRPAIAERLYTGAGHLELMAGVDAARQAGHSVPVWIVSARHGLVPGLRRLDPYEEPMPSGRHRVTARGLALGLPDAVRRLLPVPCDAQLLALGANYAAACDLAAGLGAAAALDAPTFPRTVVFAAPELVLQVRAIARRYGVPLVGVDAGVGAAKLYEVAPRALKPHLVARWLADPERFARLAATDAPAEVAP